MKLYDLVCKSPAGPMRVLSKIRSAIGAHGSGARRAARAAVFAGASHFTPTLPVRANGLQFVVSTSDRALGRKLFITRSRPEFTVLRRTLEHVTPAGVFLDVGANIGTATLSSLTSFGRAIAIEPDPRNLALLRTAAKQNQLAERITLIGAAASRDEGEAFLRTKEAKHSSHQIAASGERVPTVTLDGVVRKLGLASDDIGLVWIDTEGHEPAVLEGARGLLDARIPFVVEVRESTALELTHAFAGRRLFDLRAGLWITDLAGYVASLPEHADRAFTDLLAISQ